MKGHIDYNFDSNSSDDFDNEPKKADNESDSNESDGNESDSN